MNDHDAAQVRGQPEDVLRGQERGHRVLRGGASQGGHKVSWNANFYQKSTEEGVKNSQKVFIQKVGIY